VRHSLNDSQRKGCIPERVLNTCQVHSVFLKLCAGSLLIHQVQVTNLGITKNVSDGLQ